VKSARGDQEEILDQLGDGDQGLADVGLCVDDLAHNEGRFGDHFLARIGDLEWKMKLFFNFKATFSVSGKYAIPKQ
jgi:hypothetical protein